MGYADSESSPRTFFLREGQDVDVGILKLFLTREHVDLSDVVQSSPFKEEKTIGARSQDEVDLKARFKAKLPVRLWDTSLIPVVQRRPRTREHVDLSDVVQSSPFKEEKKSISSNEVDLKAKFKAKIPVRFLWDTCLIPVVQRRARK